MMTDQQIIAVVQARAAGKTIEYRCRWVNISSRDWEVTKSPSWDFCQFEYRVKPEPREGWVVGSWLLSTREDAERVSAGRRPVYHVREVVD